MKFFSQDEDRVFSCSVKLAPPVPKLVHRDIKIYSFESAKESIIGMLTITAPEEAVLSLIRECSERLDLELKTSGKLFIEPITNDKAYLIVGQKSIDLEEVHTHIGFMMQFIPEV